MLIVLRRWTCGQGVVATGLPETWSSGSMLPLLDTRITATMGISTSRRGRRSDTAPSASCSPPLREPHPRRTSVTTSGKQLPEPLPHSSTWLMDQPSARSKALCARRSRHRASVPEPLPAPGLYRFSRPTAKTPFCVAFSTDSRRTVALTLAQGTGWCRTRLPVGVDQGIAFALTLTTSPSKDNRVTCA